MKKQELGKKGSLLKKRKWFGLNMTFYFSLIIISEIVLSIGIASGLTYAFNEWFNLFDYLKPSLSILIVGTVVAVSVTVGFNRFFLVPIEKLNGGMDKVRVRADIYEDYVRGDAETRRQIEKIYGGIPTL